MVGGNEGSLLLAGTQCEADDVEGDEENGRRLQRKTGQQRQNSRAMVKWGDDVCGL
jgi:hypothetical protein